MIGKTTNATIDESEYRNMSRQRTRWATNHNSDANGNKDELSDHVIGVGVWDDVYELVVAYKRGRRWRDNEGSGYITTEWQRGTRQIRRCRIVGGTGWRGMHLALLIAMEGW